MKWLSSSETFWRSLLLPQCASVTDGRIDRQTVYGDNDDNYTVGTTTTVSHITILRVFATVKVIPTNK